VVVVVLGLREHEAPCRSCDLVFKLSFGFGFMDLVGLGESVVIVPVGESGSVTFLRAIM